MKPEKKQTSNAIIFKLTGGDAARESHQVRPKSLKIFQPSYASRTIEQSSLFLKTMISDDFLSSGAFHNQNPVNKPAKNNKRILMAAVFHFVNPVKKTVKP